MAEAGQSAATSSGRRTQRHRQIAAGTPLGEDVLLLRTFTGTEKLGRLFRFELDLLSEDPQINFDDILGHNVTVRLEVPQPTAGLRDAARSGATTGAGSGGEPRYFNGYVSEFVQTRRSGRLAHYRMEVVPWLWFLTRTSDCRIFQEKTVPDIIKQVFRDHGFTDFEDRLSESYRTWEYCVQYRETDFSFVSRLMEQEGIYYYFVHENGKHTLILADGPSSHEPCPGHETIPFHIPQTALPEQTYIRDWVIRQQVQPGVWAQTDFNFKNPTQDLQVKAKITRGHAQPDFEMFEYPGEYVEFAEGETCARSRIDEIHTEFEEVQGQTDVRGVCTGCTFGLTGHPRQDQARTYLVTSARYHARTDEYQTVGVGTGEPRGELTFDCTFTAIDQAQRFRSRRITPKPLIRGPQTAIVVGKAGEEIWTDEYGRVKVQFHWDRYSAADENSSCWIRVSQGWAGKRWGAMYIPRIGQEVIVEFLEGDPDRPIITGRVYNGAAMPPYDLPANKTRSTLKSNSTIGGGGFNEIRFEDKKGGEQVFIHAQRNEDERVLNDSFEWIGNDRHRIVKKKQYELVEEDKHLHVKLNQYEQVNETMHLHVGKDLFKLVDNDGHQHVKNNLNVKVDNTLSETVGMNFQQKVGMSHAVDAGMDMHLKAGMNIVIEAGLTITLKAGGGFIVVGPTGVTISGTPVLINSGGSAGSGAGSNPTEPTDATDPTDALEADTAEAGGISQAQARGRAIPPGRFGSASVGAFEGAGEQPQLYRLQYQLLDPEGNPMSGEPYRVKLPDGSVREGSTDAEGMARFEQVEEGETHIQFPNRDDSEWFRVEQTSIEE